MRKIFKFFNLLLPAQYRNENGFVGTIISVVTAIANAVVAAVGLSGGVASLASGALQGAFYGAATGAAMGGITGSGAGKGAARGAITGAFSGGALGAGAGTIGTTMASAAGGAAGAAATGGNVGRGALQGAATGLIASSFASRASAGLKNRLPSQTVGHATPSGYSGSVTVPGVRANIPISQAGRVAGAVGSAGAGFDSQPTGDLARSQSPTGNLTGGQPPILGGEKGGLLSSSNTRDAGVALAGKVFGPERPTTIDFDPVKEYRTIKNILGKDAIPSALEKQSLDYIGSSIQDIVRDEGLAFESDRMTRLANESFDRQIDNIKRSFSDRPGGYKNSSQAFEAINEINQNRETQLSEIRQGLAMASIDRAIGLKRDFLDKSIQSNQFSMNTAMELAGVLGRKAELETALQQENVNDFQEIILSLMQSDYDPAEIYKSIFQS